MTTKKDVIQACRILKARLDLIEKNETYAKVVLQSYKDVIIDLAAWGLGLE